MAMLEPTAKRQCAVDALGYFSDAFAAFRRAAQYFCIR
jgi:hypothetical protein